MVMLVQDNKYNYNSHSGRFNKRVSIHGPIITSDEIGNQIKTFGEMCKVWAMVKTTKGSEYAAAAQTKSLTITRFVVRYSKSLDELFSLYKTKIEFHYKQAKYDVVSIFNDDEQNKTFTIIAESRE